MKFRKELNAFFENHEGEYDILHIHDPIFARFIYGIAKKKGIKKVIVHSHATMYSDKKIAKIRNGLLCRNLNSYADEFFACSIAAGNFLFKNNEFYVLNNAIWSERFSFSENERTEIRKQLNLNDNLVIGHVGAFRRQKNHSFLIDIFKVVKRKEKTAKLLLVGDGNLLDEIREKARKMNLLNDILFLGKREDTYKLYQAMDVFVLPSLFEGLPMVGIEAQCADLPIVMSKSITYEAGIGNFKFLDLADSPELWANTIIQMEKEKKGRSRDLAIEQLKRSGFDIKIESEKLEKKYLKMIED